MGITVNTSCCVKVFSKREEMGMAAGRDIEAKIVELLREKAEVRIIFAAAPSQNEVLDYLANSKMVEWSRVTAFHMDEYIGLSPHSPSSFSSFLTKRIFDRVPFKKVHLLDGSKPVEDEIERYSKEIQSADIDIACLGIGDNGHIAFNDPPVADFSDPKVVKSVSLDLRCRQQQVNESCFATLDAVPQKALTLTVPTLMSAHYLFCVVPGKAKREAVSKALFGPLSESCPASILRTHNYCRFYFDTLSYSMS